LPVTAAFITFIDKNGVGNLSADYKDTVEERAEAEWGEVIRILYDKTTDGEKSDEEYLKWLQDFSRWNMLYSREREDNPSPSYPCYLHSESADTEDSVDLEDGDEVPEDSDE
jgi:hypothetical protein